MALEKFVGKELTGTLCLLMDVNKAKWFNTENCYFTLHTVATFKGQSRVLLFVQDLKTAGTLYIQRQINMGLTVLNYSISQTQVDSN